MRHGTENRNFVSEVAEAVVSLLERNELSDVTLAAIAARSGISPEWLASVFPDVNSVFFEVLEQEARRVEAHEFPPPKTPDEVEAYLDELGNVELSMSLPCATISSFALDGGFDESGAGSSIRPMLMSQFEQQWIDPLLGVGFHYEAIYPVMLSLLRTCFGLTAAIEGELLRRDIAIERLTRAISVAIDTLEFPPRHPLTEPSTEVGRQKRHRRRFLRRKKGTGVTTA